MKKSTIISLILIIAAFLIGYGLGTQKQAPVGEKEVKQGGEKVSKEEIKIGAILGLTGPGAFYSEDVLKGMELARKELQIGGTILKFVIEDGKTNAKDSVSAFNKLTNMDNVDMIISLFSVSSVPLVPLANESKIPLLVSITSAKDIAKNPFVVQYYLKAEDYAYPIATAVADRTYTKVALMYEMDDFGKSVGDAFIEKFSELGGEVIMTETYNIPDMDYRIQLTKIKNSEAEAIVFAGFKPHYVNVMKNIKEIGITLPFFEISPNTMYPSAIQESGDATEGNIAVSLNFPIEGNLKFEEAYKKEYNKNPNVASSLGYDMVMLISEATRGRKMNGQEIIDAIVNMKKFNGLNGSVQITDNGEFRFPVFLVEVKNGSLVKLR